MAYWSTDMVRDESHFIDGRWVQGSGSIPILDSYSELPIAAIAEGTESEIDHAVAAARRSLGAWRRLPAEERCAYLMSVADAIAACSGEIAATISREVGMPIGLSERIQVGLPVSNMRYFGGSAGWRQRPQVDNSLIVAEPYGVVACITPWNYPLHQLVSKVAPALVVGNCVVVKPSEQAPLSAMILAHLFDAIGLPPGVFNVVTGTGAGAGAALAAHPGVDMISFTGSSRVGVSIATSAAQAPIPVSLELGGKSAALLLPTADAARAVKATVNSCLLNSGQTCNALTRLVVPRSRYDEVVERVQVAVARFVMGDPFADSTRLGPLVSDRHRHTVLAAIDAARAEGAPLVAGGAVETPDSGFFVAPTVFSVDDPTASIAQEEVFGPVLTLQTYDDVDEAVAIANGTRYGLAAAVWGPDLDSAVDVAHRLDVGQVDVNGAVFNPFAPFGGFKRSGIGREGGSFGLEEFSQLKSIQLPTGR